MSDNLEKFIRQNRRDFDQQEPSPQSWSKIESALPVKKETRRFTLRDVYKWSAAAAITVIILTSLYFLVIRKNSHETPINGPVGQVDPLETNGIAPEYAAEFREVYSSIGEKQRELRSRTAGQPALYDQFRADLVALDSAYHLLKEQAAQSPNKDMLIRAMIQNLRLQADLLTRQLMITNQLNNNTKKSTNETSI